MSRDKGQVGALAILVGVGLLTAGAVTALRPGLVGATAVGDYVDVSCSIDSYPSTMMSGRSYSVSFSVDTTYSATSVPDSASWRYKWSVHTIGSSTEANQTVASGASKSESWPDISWSKTASFTYNPHPKTNLPTTGKIWVNADLQYNDGSGWKYAEGSTSGIKSVDMRLEEYTLSTSVNPSGGGTVSLSPSGGTYEKGTTVTATATANSGYSFDRWSGASSSTSNTVTVTMDSDKSLTAQFSEVQQPTEYNLTTDTKGMGSVSAEGSSPYDEGTTVKVTATPDSGWKFDRWDGDISGTSNPIYVTMDSDKTVRAVFVEKQAGTYTLLTDVYSGQGSVSVTPDRSTYEEGTEVQLTARPDEGYVFKEWKGDVSGSSNPTTVTMTSDKSVSAVFEREQPTKVTLTMKSSPTEGGSITMLQSEKIQVTKGKTVTIQAYSNSGYRFDHWSGDISGESKSVTITMDADRTVVANFVKEKGITGIIASNVQYVLMALGSVILVVGVVKISR